MTYIFMTRHLTTQEELKHLKQKLKDLEEPGAIVEFDPVEAEELGFIIETAISLEDAMAARFDEVEENE